MLKEYCQQHGVSLPEHSHVGSVPKMALVINALAQPIPDSTEMAPPRQFLAQAPHSIQASWSTILAFRSSITKTPCGQTLKHILHPLHFSMFTASVVTPER